MLSGHQRTADISGHFLAGTSRPSSWFFMMSGWVSRKNESDRPTNFTFLHPLRSFVVNLAGQRCGKDTEQNIS